MTKIFFVKNINKVDMTYGLCVTSDVDKQQTFRIIKINTGVFLQVASTTPIAI